MKGTFLESFIFMLTVMWLISFSDDSILGQHYSWEKLSLGEDSPHCKRACYQQKTAEDAPESLDRPGLKSGDRGKALVTNRAGEKGTVRSGMAPLKEESESKAAF